MSAQRDGAPLPAERLTLGVAARLSRYLQVLTEAKKMGKETISSQELSDYTHVNPTQIRRDLSGFGKFGKRGVGYNIDSLVDQIRKILRTSGSTTSPSSAPGTSAWRSPPRTSSATMASASSRSSTWIRRRWASAWAACPCGTSRSLRRVVDEQDIVVGVLAVPPTASQELADQLVEAGVRIIFNYSGSLLTVPPDVTVHTSSPAVDLLYALYFYLT